MKPAPQAALTETFTYVLLSLTQPLHGYGIMQKVEKLSCGRVRLGPGTLYGAITNLSERGWIAEVAGETGRKRVYRLTGQGESALRREMDRLEELLFNGRAQLAQCSEDEAPA